MNREQLQQQLAPFGQEHLLSGWDRLSDPQRRRLAAQIQTIDFELIGRLWTDGLDETRWPRDLGQHIKSPPAIRLQSDQNRFTAEQARARGDEALAAGQVAVLLVAGGQGSRLGFPHPKGMLPVAPLSQRTLFQIHFDRLRALQQRYGRTIPLLLMTSPATHDETVDYLRGEVLGGLAQEQVVVFCQGTMPAVDAQTGHILLESPGTIFVSPDGHGGVLAALDRAGLLARLTEQQFEHVFYFQVDNPLVAVADPTFIGYHLLAHSEMTTQVVAKSDPLERVGNLVEVDGRLQIIEYSDLPEDVARLRGVDGTLQVWAGSIAVHMFAIEFLQRMQQQPESLPFHRALKRVPHADATGAVIDPSSPNAVKFERFIFDILPQARNGLVVEVAPAEAFAPVKNVSGSATDTKEAAQAAMVAQHRRWLQAAGATVAPECMVEIHPLFAQDARELCQRMQPGTTVDCDTYFV